MESDSKKGEKAPRFYSEPAQPEQQDKQDEEHLRNHVYPQISLRLSHTCLRYSRYRWSTPAIRSSSPSARDCTEATNNRPAQTARLARRADPIDIGSPGLGMSTKTTDPVVQVVDGDEQDVGRFVFGKTGTNQQQEA